MFDKFMETMAGEDELERLQQYGADLNFRAGNTNMAIRHSAAGGNVYMYYMEKPGVNELYGVLHGGELPYLFDNDMHHVGETFPPKECEFRHEIKEMWVNFAKTGNPSLNDGEVEGIEAIQWDKFVPDNYPVMVFNSSKTRQENDPVREGSDLIEDLFWLRIKNK